MTQPHSNRSRTKTKLTTAKRHQSSLANPHDRIQVADDNTSQKRSRETGDTPPSVTQPNKKASGKNSAPLNVAPQTTHSKAEEKRLRRRQKQKSAKANVIAGNLPGGDMS